MNYVGVALPLVVALGAVDLQGQAEPLRGTWQVYEVVTSGPNARTIASPPPGLLIFTGTHYSVTEVRTEQTRPEPADFDTATANELRAVWGPFRAQAGRYEVSGNTITTRAMVAKNPAVMEPTAVNVYSYRLQGDTLWLTLQRNPEGPVANRATVEYRRIE